jgi:predicted ATPase
LIIPRGGSIVSLRLINLISRINDAMEIKFIWIGQYGMIKNLGVNFNHSGQHSFEYHLNRLRISMASKSPLNFGDKVPGLTVIAGENGSGKTTLCQALLSTLATTTENVMGYNNFFDGIVVYGMHIFHHKDLPISNKKELTLLGYSLRKYTESPLEGMHLPEREDFAKSTFIYYSHQFDPRGYFSEVNLLNLSTEALIAEDFKYSSSYHLIGPSSRPDLSDDRSHVQRTDFEIFRRAEQNRIMLFFLNKPAFIPFKAPPGIVLYSSFSGNNRWLSDWDEQTDNWQRNQQEREILSLIFPISGSSSYSQSVRPNIANFKEAILKLYRLNLVRALFHMEKTGPKYSQVYDFVFGTASAESLWPDKKDIVKLLRCHKYLVDIGQLVESEFNPSNLASLHKQYWDNWRFYLIERLYLVNTPVVSEKLRQFSDLESLILTDENGFYRRVTDLSFTSSLSSGEYSFISLFSRVYEALERIRRHEEKREFVTIFLDEPEVGYHPAWSKSLLKWILDFLNGYPEKISFQLIMTTHSPYLLSDLAQQNVILLKKGEKGETVLVPSDSFRIFAGNIHDLLANSFFLSDGSIGQYAKSVLNEVIDRMNYWRLRPKPTKANEVAAFEKDRIKASQIIPIVADELIRNKLTELFAAAFEQGLPRR